MYRFRHINLPEKLGALLGDSGTPPSLVTGVAFLFSLFSDLGDA